MQFVESFVRLGKYGIFALPSVEIQVPVGLEVTLPTGVGAYTSQILAKSEHASPDRANTARFAQV